MVHNLCIITYAINGVREGIQSETKRLSRRSITWSHMVENSIRHILNCKSVPNFPNVKCVELQFYTKENVSNWKKNTWPLPKGKIQNVSNWNQMHIDARDRPPRQPVCVELVTSPVSRIKLRIQAIKHCFYSPETCWSEICLLYTSPSPRD